MPLRILCIIATLQLAGSSLQADDEEIVRLIDQLVEIDEPGFGYSAYYSGGEFLPYEGTGSISTAVLGAVRATRSEALRGIVERGADAVPALIEHMDDDRTLSIEPLRGMMWMDFSDEYDFNSRTAAQPPADVNTRGDVLDQGEPNQHALTVGDLCFVALGQIVNRSFAASRYQPTGGLIVNSPTYSPALRKAIVKDWGTLTRERHQELLVADFATPDHEDRRSGAYLRLAFYYPEAVEALVLDELSKPVVDTFAVATFCRDTLYAIADATERQEKYDTFLREHGPQYAIGVREQLFDDLRRLEAHERGAVRPPLTMFGTQPRELLIQLFSLPAEVRSADRPVGGCTSESERARFVGGLIHDDSQEVGDVVKGLFLDSPEDDYLTPACLRCLASRGYADFLVEQLGRVDIGSQEVNYLHRQYIEAIATSNEQAVRDSLLALVKSTPNDAYFMAALPAIDRQHDALILKLSVQLLAGLPEDTEQGRGVLEMIGERFPEQAKEIYKSFLVNGSANRAETMCVVLWYGNPLSKEILAPLLDDKRSLPGFSIPMRVCDRAAQAISHTSEDIRFDSDWPVAERDEQIEKLKEYCRMGADK